MSHVLTLDVPSEIYESLRQIAEQAGQSPEVVAIKYLATVTGQVTDDPMEDFIGAWRSNGLAWPDQHDTYLGQAIAKHSTDARNSEYDD